MVQALNTIVKCTPLALTLGAAPLLKAANMRAIAKFVGTAKGDVLLSSYANVAKGQALPHNSLCMVSDCQASYIRGQVDLRSWPLRCHSEAGALHEHQCTSMPDCTAADTAPPGTH